jgi:hypothetical protein
MSGTSGDSENGETFSSPNLLLKIVRAVQKGGAGIPFRLLSKKIVMTDLRGIHTSGGNKKCVAYRVLKFSAKCNAWKSSVVGDCRCT